MEKNKLFTTSASPNFLSYHLLAVIIHLMGKKNAVLVRMISYFSELIRFFFFHALMLSFINEMIK